uniref:Zinc finger GRF-type domain-containing protein n=1 Tax=Zea mays TaxID=4577 RepID=A0A804LET2_MAIZE
MSQAWSSTVRSRRRSTARDVVEPRPLVVVAVGTVPIGVDLEAPIDDVTGLPLIMCPDCKDVRVFAANTTYSNNVGKRFFKCPRKNRRNGTCDRFWFEEEYLVFLQDNGYLPSTSSTIAAGSTTKVPELVGKIDSLEQNLNKTVRDVISPKKKEGRGKAINSDNDYDPCSDIENQSDTDDDYDDDLNNEVNTEATQMVPGTRPHQKKQKAGTMPAANHQPPRTPVRLIRQSAAMPSPGGRPPPKPRHPLPPKTTSKATPKRNAISSSTQQQVQASTTTTETTETTNPVSFPPKMTRSTQAMSSPVRNTMPRPTRHTMHSPPRFTRASAAMSSPGANPHHSPPRFTRASATMSSPSANPHHSTPAATAIVSHQPSPTTSVNKTVPTDNSPGGHNSRQSNAIIESAKQFDATTSEGNPNEGEPVGDLVPALLAPKKNVHKKTMGHGLEKMLNRGNQLAIHVAEGKKRPEVPLQAAKLASKTGVALRDNLPIYKSWKLYDNAVGQEESRLDVDVKNEGPSKDACTDIIKRGVRQTRYNLKRKYFDESLTKEQLLAMQPPPKMKKEDWTGLVEYWCDPKNQEKSAKNKAN